MKNQNPGLQVRGFLTSTTDFETLISRIIRHKLKSV